MTLETTSIPFTSLFDPCENRIGPCENRIGPCENRIGPCEIKFDHYENKIGHCEIRFDHYENRIESSEIKFDLYENRIGLCENRIIVHCIIETISCILVCSICQELLASGIIYEVAHYIYFLTLIISYKINTYTFITYKTFIDYSIKYSICVLTA